MRQNDMVKHLRDNFPVMQDHNLAVDIADAMHDASKIGGGQIGSFTHEGVNYYIRTSWYDGCISGDCNPATCYTDWTLTHDIRRECRECGTREGDPHKMSCDTGNGYGVWKNDQFDTTGQVG